MLCFELGRVKQCGELYERSDELFNELNDSKIVPKEKIKN